MSNVSIFYKTKSRLIEEIEKNENVNTLNDTSLLKKFSFSKKEFADIYFHAGPIDKEAIVFSTNAKAVIVNSFALRHKLSQEAGISEDKVHVIYPSVNENGIKSKEAKEKICDEFDIDKKKKIILFYAKNFKTSGIKEFLNIVFSLNYKNKQIVIAGDNKQIYNLKFQISKYQRAEELLLIEDYNNIDELFLATDVFILPTYNESFASSIIKAMYSKCAVFVSANNYAREVVDVFATMENPNDPSTSFKVDALLSRKEDLKLIKKQNKKASKEFLFDLNIQRVNEIIQSV